MGLSSFIDAVFVPQGSEAEPCQYTVHDGAARLTVVAVEDIL